MFRGSAVLEMRASGDLKPAEFWEEQGLSHTGCIRSQRLFSPPQVVNWLGTRKMKKTIKEKFRTVGEGTPKTTGKKKISPSKTKKCKRAQVGVLDKNYARRPSFRVEGSGLGAQGGPDWVKKGNLWGERKVQP